MQKTISKKIVMIMFLGMFFGVAYITVSAQNSINGIVFDDNRKPIQNIEVELLDDLERLVQSTKTKGSGLYFFQNLRAGIYYIKVKVGGTNFKSQKERINLGSTNRTIQTGSGTRTSGSDVQQKNFYLQVDSRRVNSGLPSRTGVLFAQEIPEDAKKAYESGLKNVKKDKKKLAQKDFEEALKIFPDYFDALSRLANMQLAQKQYIEAENLFIRAIKINKRSFSSHFGLAVTQNKLKKKNDAVNHLEIANKLDANSINSHLLLGIIYRDLKQSQNAEKNLLKAKELSDNQVPDVHWNLALLYYYDFKKYNTAADELELLIKAIPKNERKKLKAKIQEYKGLIKTLRKKAKQTS